MLAETHGLHETFAQALNSKSVLMGRTHRPRESKVLIQGALAVALEHDLHRAALRAYNNLVAGLWVNDEWVEETEQIEQALALARRVGDRHWEVSFTAGSVGGLVRVDLKPLDIPSMEEAAQIYCNVTNSAVPDLNWYFAYNLFRLAGITQGIAGRIRDGTAASAKAMESAKRTVPLSKASWEYAQKAGAV